MGAPHRTRTRRHWRPGRSAAYNTGRACRPGFSPHRRIHSRGWRAGAVHPHLVPLASAFAGAGRSRARIARDRHLVERMVRSLYLRRGVARSGGPLAYHIEGAYLYADGRNRRGAHDFAAGTSRRRAQLGLPLLLASRRDLCTVRAHDRRLHRRSACLASLAAARDRRQTVAGEHHVRRHGRAPATGARARMAARLRRLRSGAHRQRRLRAIPTRRIRRSHGFASFRPSVGPQSRRERLAAAMHAHEFRRDRLDSSRRRHLGSARTATAFYPFQSDGVGRARPRH